uniref:Phospholipase D beta 1 n=1 Tax=Anthurium amnicola TaxID=1678845 RepID=A0A1D1YWX0_9ARAE
MASYVPYSSSLKSSAHGGERLSPESSKSSSNGFPAGTTAPQHPEPTVEAPEGFMGSLDVYIHQARDIHNICIYHKQDVYAKICLTSDPEASVSTKIINGGGKNPVFNENLHLSVRTVESTLKCEIWMLSRVKNYLEDQLLGFAVVPLSDVIIENGKLTREFSLSSTDLFHSPAGFVQLSLSYIGSLPEVMAIAPHPPSVIADTPLPDSENDDSIPCELDKIEFPDLKVVNENQRMVSEYFGIPCDKLESEGSESLVTSEDGNCPDSEAGVRVVKSFSSDSFDSVGAVKSDTPSSVSTNESPSPFPATSQSFSEVSGATGSSEHKEKTADGEADSSASRKTDAFTPPIIKIDMPEQTVVQQDIVDMYMKSMQQFTESLAKMKLPMDAENNSTSPENDSSGSEQKLQTPKGSGSRVFYGSRAFF